MIPHRAAWRAISQIIQRASIITRHASRKEHRLSTAKKNCLRSCRRTRMKNLRDTGFPFPHFFPFLTEEIARRRPYFETPRRMRQIKNDPRQLSEMEINREANCWKEESLKEYVTWIKLDICVKELIRCLINISHLTLSGGNLINFVGWLSLKAIIKHRIGGILEELYI